MVKKIRFPLKMENGVEVRSIEELRNNFSISKVLSYLQEGKLITWLRDRYINDIADSIEKLDLQDEELAKKIYELFDVSYDETAENELENAVERANRILLLKNYTDDKQYEAVIDHVVFNQEELYDRLDEDADTIYLCGEKFDIPLSKLGVAYIGINNPVAVIDSKVEIDWDTIGISIKNITFDEKYQAVLDRANEEEETVQEVPDTKNLPHSTQKEIAKFLSLILKKTEELHDREWDYKYDDICEEFELDEIEAYDYGNSEYTYHSQTKAKHACREQLNIIINDVKEQYQGIRYERYKEILENCETVNFHVSKTLEDINIEADDFIGDCEDDIAVQKIRKLLYELNLNGKIVDYSMVNQAFVLTAKLLPEKTTAIKKISDYLEMCCYDEYSDMYSYDLEDAADKMVDDVNNAANAAIDTLYDALEVVYQDIVDALGVFILKSAYNRLVLGAEHVKPALLSIDELVEKISIDNMGEGCDAVERAMVRGFSNHPELCELFAPSELSEMLGTQGKETIEAIKLAKQNLSDNEKVFIETMNQVNEYLKRI